MVDAESLPRARTAPTLQGSTAGRQGLHKRNGRGCAAPIARVGGSAQQGPGRGQWRLLGTSIACLTSIMSWSPPPANLRGCRRSLRRALGHSAQENACGVWSCGDVFGRRGKSQPDRKIEDPATRRLPSVGGARRDGTMGWRQSSNRSAEPLSQE